MSLFITITAALVAAFVGGMLARRFKLPAIAGYLLAGVAIGPATPGFVGDSVEIAQLAEMGVIFMMFGVGLHFSLRDLFSVKSIAVPGAILQMVLGTLMGMGLAHLWGWSADAGFVLGLAISIASTVVLLRGLSDAGEAQTTAGKVATGWLILEDLATVAILVLMPLVFGSGAESAGLLGALKAIGAAAAFIGIMLLVGSRVLPWLLTRIARLGSRELFILAVVAVSLGTAFGAAQFFGVSLALGAFLAGVVVRESDAGHQVGAELVPFRDIFSILFFVSVGMLVDPVAIARDPIPVLVLALAIVVGKWLINMLLGFVLPASGRTMLVVAAGLSQIGEFSFIVGQTGMHLGVLSSEQYSFILAGAVISIVANPFVFRFTPAIERRLSAIPAIWGRLERRLSEKGPETESLEGHVVVVGGGRVGGQVVKVMDQLSIPVLVVEVDAECVDALRAAGHLAMFGDATSPEVLSHTRLPYARAMVVTVADDVSAELVVASARGLAPAVPVVTRAESVSSVERLLDLGAHHVVHPELEGGLEIIRHTLLDLGFAPDKIQRYSDDVRRHAYSLETRGGRPHALDQMVSAAKTTEIHWYRVTADSLLCDACLAETNVRGRTGASVVAVIRGDETIPNPTPDMVFRAGDMVGLIGDATELAAAADLLDPR